MTVLKDGKVTGNLYLLDYREHVEYVKKMSVSAEKVKVIYEKGEYYQDIIACRIQQPEEAVVSVIRIDPN